ncbi:uncharacterized protein LTR77_000792 [Saxophila tyrrhenica]|uniref:Aminoglycoside phosphotransferase domain-containing protein n=1 Tax=Saxophila tyrrhenica TaxID=1690608 RepID=A0AAV9PQY3_9PEZI|nr:hypothetical protein LTR77_000792 [Saxophila tyrrhenica]
MADLIWPDRGSEAGNGFFSEAVTSRSDAAADTTATLADNAGCRVVVQPNNRVLKYGCRVNIGEAHALKFGRELQMPVPVVHETRSLREGGIEICMDFIPGQPLEDIWPTMSAEQKTSIALQLRQIVTTMRSRYRPSNLALELAEADQRWIATPPAIRTSISRSLRTDHRVVFTHGDLNPRNIIVENGTIKALLDWEFAGWYPEYWEYVKFFERGTSCKDWKSFADTVFADPYYDELVTFQALIRWQMP